MKSHKIEDLKVWSKSMTLVKEVYLVTADLPNDERFGLISQIRRCAVSIPSNIAEGAGRNSKNEFYQFLGIAFGSTYELQTQLQLLIDLNFISETKIVPLKALLAEIQKMIYSLKTSLKL
ncbi:MULTISPECIES: four helix bundle protein [Chryseobacterium]|uniref:Four helix bundle protein n=1 Tax=Chryseobacterium taihuense TaxID=1141221 RepID=A0A4U8WC40_9FLAO|nr:MULTISPECIES: four helix bundle protein [Chryseobacterium]QQV04208.1 four helix bundle protein [Chryseobacterium sp. FDAARGOS 1104]VFB02425.1 four helix bundle protein [Chryseobacterium taihuense]